ncbi:MAG TPA: FAD-dependent monooxygenase, partial [bacterium]|nr:FAD-dependent monooxygenase [bacterium]
MKVTIAGGGPAGLYLAILMKRADPSHQVRILERNRPAEAPGFGVVFSDATMGNLAEADRESYEAITDAFHHWDDIHIHYRGELLSSTGHGFAGMGRRRLLEILERRAEALGAVIEYEREVKDAADLAGADLVVGADGVNSVVREMYKDRFRPTVDERPNRFVWLGTTRPFPAFTFYFRENEHGLWRVHAYQYAPNRSTFIVEATDETFRKSGLDPQDEDATLAFCADLFREELVGHELLKNRSVWRRFPTIRNAAWSADNVVLMGDAVHTAHFSVGSGTKLALEDAIELAAALDQEADLRTALERYERVRRPDVESLQRAAQVSLRWFEDTERYFTMEPIQFGFTLLTRSLRITHEDLKERDPAYVRSIDEWFAAGAAERSGQPVERKDGRCAPPMFTPFRLRELLLPNRVVVSAMCQYCAEDGTPDDWHFVHLGSRAVGGAGLVMTEMTVVGDDARITPGCAGLYREEHLPAWRRIVDFVHRHSEARVGMQLGHAGRKGSTRLAWEGMDQPLEHGGWEVLGPSPIPWAQGNPVPREVDRADMDRVRDDFVRSAEMAREAGFDLLEVHFAHGYLLATFLSPLTNQRRDEYGGSLENRLRFPLE